MQTSGEQIVRAMAFAVEAEAKRQVDILRAIDTGTLRNSIYTKTDKGTYANGSSTNGGLPDLQLPKKSPKTGRVVTEAMVNQGHIPEPGHNQANVGPSVEYGLYVELGTTKMTQRPYLENAVNTVAGSGQFAKAVREVVKKYE